jgi:hypothetical protein
MGHIVCAARRAWDPDRLLSGRDLGGPASAVSLGGSGIRRRPHGDRLDRSRRDKRARIVAGDKRVPDKRAQVALPDHAVARRRGPGRLSAPGVPGE